MARQVFRAQDVGVYVRPDDLEVTVEGGPPFDHEGPLYPDSWTLESSTESTTQTFYAIMRQAAQAAGYKLITYNNKDYYCWPGYDFTDDANPLTTATPKHPEAATYPGTITEDLVVFTATSGMWAGYTFAAIVVPGPSNTSLPLYGTGNQGGLDGALRGSASPSSLRNPGFVGTVQRWSHDGGVWYATEPGVQVLVDGQAVTVDQAGSGA